MAKKFFAALVLTLAVSPAWAEIGIEATINPSRVVVGQTMTLTVVVNGASSVQPPVLPKWPNFRSYSQGHSQEIQFVNGVMSSRSVFSYALLPQLPGKHVLGQLELEIDGKPYKTGVLEVEVLDANDSSSIGRSPVTSAPVAAPAARSLPPEYMGGKDIFVRAWADKEEAYVNEPIYLTYTIYTRVSATFKGFDREPDTAGFWVEEFPPQGSVRRQEKTIGGQRYVVADVRTVALFPQEPGAYTLDPGTMSAEIEVHTADQFDRFYSTDIFGFRTYRRRPFRVCCLSGYRRDSERQTYGNRQCNFMYHVLIIVCKVLKNFCG